MARIPDTYVAEFLERATLQTGCRTGSSSPLARFRQQGMPIPSVVATSRDLTFSSESFTLPPVALVQNVQISHLRAGLPAVITSQEEITKITTRCDHAAQAHPFYTLEEGSLAVDTNRSAYRFFMGRVIAESTAARLRTRLHAE